MQSTLSEQIQAIQKARMLAIKEATSPNTSEDLRAAYYEISRLLNDAGSTIVGLKMALSAFEKTKSTNIGAMDHSAKTANSFFEQLLEISNQQSL